MNIDDFMNELESYNTDSDTITGYFNLDENETEQKMRKIVKSLDNAEKKSDLVILIDSLTDSKVEAIVLASLLFEKMGEMNESTSPIIPMKIAMAMAICYDKGLVKEQETAEKILEVFSKVFAEV